MKLHQKLWRGIVGKTVYHVEKKVKKSFTETILSRTENEYKKGITAELFNFDIDTLPSQEFILEASLQILSKMSKEGYQYMTPLALDLNRYIKGNHRKNKLDFIKKASKLKGVDKTLLAKQSLGQVNKWIHPESFAKQLVQLDGIDFSNIGIEKSMGIRDLFEVEDISFKKKINLAEIILSKTSKDKFKPVVYNSKINILNKYKDDFMKNKEVLKEFIESFDDDSFILATKELDSTYKKDTESREILTNTFKAIKAKEEEKIAKLETSFSSSMNKQHTM